MAKFYIRRTSPVDPISGILPAGAAAVIGTAYKIASKDASTGINTFALADTAGCAGFVTKPIRVGAGLTDTEIAFNIPATYPSGEVMTPYEAGAAGTLEEALDLEVESPDNLLTSGTGAVASNTAAGTALGFTNGKFYVAQTGDVAQYKLVAQMTPTDGGDVRIFVTRITGLVK